ncbi:MAG: hypothetical protein ACLFVO_08570 [Chloroflexaceae bacterium]
MASQDGYQPIDITNPFEIWRTWRDVQIDVLARGTAGIVNTAAYAQALGLYLDSYLTVAVPLQQILEKYQKVALSRLNMPARTDIISVAQRMTSIEFRLDDLDARLDQLLPLLQMPVAARGPQSGNGRQIAATAAEELAARLQMLDERTERVVGLLEALFTQQAEAASASSISQTGASDPAAAASAAGVSAGDPPDATAV